MAADPGRKKILLKGKVSAGEIMTLAGEHRWFFQDCDMAHRNQTFSVYSWLTSGTKTELAFIEDEVKDLYVLVTSGPEAEMVECVVCAAFPCWTHAEVLRQAEEAQDKDADTRLEALQRLSAVAPDEAEAADLAVYEAALAAPEPNLRYAGIEAVGYAEWPVLVERLRWMQREDPDAEVRLAALQMLRAIEKTKAAGGS